MRVRLCGAVCAGFLIFLSSVTHAALVDNGGGLIFDNVLNITWMQDANYVMTSGFDADGQMGLPDVESWVDGLVFAGHSDWRMASVDLNDDNVFVDCAVATISDCANDNELAYMYYHNLGGTGNDLTGDQTIGAITLLNIGDPNDSAYWGGRRSASHGESFQFKNSNQGVGGHLSLNHVWAVHDGNITATPVPAAVWLFGSGLVGLLGLGRRSKG